MRRVLLPLFCMTLLVALLPMGCKLQVSDANPGTTRQLPGGASANLPIIEVVSVSPPPGTPFEKGLEAYIRLEVVLRLGPGVKEPVYVSAGLGNESSYYLGLETPRRNSGRTLVLQYDLRFDEVRQNLESRSLAITDALYIHAVGPYSFRYGGRELQDGVVGIYPLADVAQPRDLVASRVNGRVVLAWDPPRNLGRFAPTGYSVYRATDPEGAWTPIAEVGLARTSFVDTPAVPEVDCFYAVKAFCRQPASAYSEPATAPLSDPAASSTWVNRTLAKGSGGEGPQAECVIITTDDLAQELGRLSSNKTRRGTPTLLYTTEWIYPRYPDAPDHAARIKAFLADLRVNGTLRYVVLAGDARTVPTRIIITGDGCHPFYPTDHYYADLSEWDWDKDGLYAEYADDRPGLRPELAVGRLPVSTPKSAHFMVDRLLSYERTPPAGDWVTRAVLAAGITHYPAKLGDGVTAKNDSAAIAEALDSLLLPERFESVRLYERGGLSPSDYPSDLPLNAENLCSSMSRGCSLAFVGSHGYASFLIGWVWVTDPDGNGLVPGENASMEVGDNPLIDVGGLPGKTTPLPTNGTKLPFMFAEACLSANFSSLPYCVGERLMTIPGGGVIGYLGASFLAFTTPDWTPGAKDASGRTLAWYFWEDLLTADRSAARPGEALATAKERYARGVTPSDLYVQRSPQFATLAAFNLLGDPEMPVWIDTPREIALDVEPSVEALEVTLRDDAGQPLAGAEVCVWDGGEGLYLTAYTDNSGAVRFALPASLNAVLDVTAFAPGFLWSMARVEVTPEGARLVNPGVLLRAALDPPIASLGKDAAIPGGA